VLENCNKLEGLYYLRSGVLPLVNCDLPNLTLLCVWQATEEDLAAITEKCTRVHLLEVRFRRHRVPVDIGHLLNCCQELTELSLWFAEISSDALGSLPPRITELFLHSCKVIERGMGAGLSTIATFSWFNFPIDRVPGAVMRLVKHCPLECLELEFCDLSDFDCTILAKSAFTHSLKYLSIVRCTITVNGLRVLANAFQQLEGLDVICCFFGESFLPIFTDTALWPNLRFLVGTEDLIMSPEIALKRPNCVIANWNARCTEIRSKMFSPGATYLDINREDLLEFMNRM